MAKPWNGSYVFSSGDLVEDLTHNFFLETGARNNKLKVYEMVDHPAARALTGYLLVRGGVHQVAYARALEKLTGANMMKLFPSPRIPTDKIPESQGAHRPRRAPEALPLLAGRLQRAARRVQRPASREAGRGARSSSTRRREGVPAHDLPPQTAVFAPDYAPEEIAEIAPQAPRRRRARRAGDRRRRLDERLGAEAQEAGRQGSAEIQGGALLARRGFRQRPRPPVVGGAGCRSTARSSPRHPRLAHQSRPVTAPG